MSDEAAIAINGQRLSDHESAVLRVAVEAFTIVMAQGIDDNDEGITRANHADPHGALPNFARSRAARAEFHKPRTVSGFSIDQ